MTDASIALDHAAVLDPPLNRLLATETGRPSAGALIVTLMGDVAAPRSAPIPAALLRALLARYGIGDAAVRKAVNRLVAAGWLETERAGRLSSYRPSALAAAEIAEAARRVYAPPRRAWTETWRLVVLGDGGDREGRRDALLAHGFRAIGAGLLARPIAVDEGCLAAPASDASDLVFVGRLDGADVRALAAQWDVPAAAAAYGALSKAIEPFTLEAAAALAPADAAALRIALIHRFRLAALAEPSAPPSLLPSPWPGDEARQRTVALYRTLGPASDAWFATFAGAAATAPSPPADERFSDD